MSEQSGIGIYPVGVLANVKNHGYREGLRRSARHIRWLIKDRNWRGVRSTFNGYLAEWHYPPPHEQVAIYKAGRGWTRKAALHDLGKHIAVSNLEPTETLP